MADDTLFGGVGAPWVKIIAGFAGSVLALAFLKDLSRWQMLVNAGGGGAAAAFMSPAIIAWVGMKEDGWQNFTIFLTGLLSMSFLAGVMVIAKTWRENPGNAAAAIADILAKFRGAK